MSGGSSRPRIGVDLRALVPTATGIGVYSYSLLRELIARGGCDYVGLAHREPRAAADLEALGLPLEWQSAPYGIVWQQLVLPRRLRRGDIDLLFSPIQTLPLRSPVPGVVTIHDLTPLLHPQLHRFKARLSFVPFVRGTLRAARTIVAVSRATADDLLAHFPAVAGRVEVVYNGVDSEFRPAGAAQIAATRQSLGCADGFILFAGTLEPRKNVGLLLDVWEEMRRSDPSTPPLVLAGPYGWRSRGLVRRIEALRPLGLRSLGHLPRPELIRLFQAASLFVYPSLYEGFGLPPAEAMACGVPVVSTTAASLPEVVGDAGLLVEPADGPALRRALSRVLDDPGLAAELRAAGPIQAGRFQWSTAAAAMESIFVSALG